MNRAHRREPSRSLHERYQAGKELRARIPRAAHGRWSAVESSTQRLAILDAANAGRLPALLPEKRRRMRASPFAFFRGAAPLMADDLARLRRTNLTVQICGDAHVRNLGAYRAADGAIVFDLNDFDETTAGPWEWDVKRLATSLVLAGREAGETGGRLEESVRVFVASYRWHLGEFAAMRFTALARYLIARRGDTPVLDDIVREAKRITPARNLRRLTIEHRGRFRFHDTPPDLKHVSRRTAAGVLRGLTAYREALPASPRETFSRYRPADVAFKLVGTGSVGTRDYVVLAFGNGVADPLFLQVKQAVPSCYAPYLRAAPRDTHHGRRVADGQQRMQTLSDPLLGYTRVEGRDYLVRQLADHKAALAPTELNRRTLVEYAALCGEVLAKGHARTGDAAVLSGYVGRSNQLDDAIAAFATAYADQTVKDYRAFCRMR